MRDILSDRRGSAVQWFALAAAAVCVASLAGAHGLDWLSQSGRISLVAFRSPTPARLGEIRRAAADQGIDMTPTGSVPAGGRSDEGAGNALVIRIR